MFIANRGPGKKNLRLYPLLFVFLSFAAQSQALVQWAGGKDHGTADYFTWQNGGSSKGLYGNPTETPDIDNAFTFAPVNFTAQSVVGKAGLITDALQFEISAIDGKKILGINIAEEGNYKIVGNGKVTATGTIKIKNLETNVEIATPLQMTPSMPKISTSGTLIGDWSGIANVDISSLNWSHISVYITNQLMATGPDSYIQKSHVGTGTDGAMNIQILIPEPATLAIFGMGILLFPITRKRANLTVILFIMCTLCFASTSNATSYVQSESSTSTNSLFGPVILNNDNTFIFSPSDFCASATGSSNATYDKLVFDIAVLPGYEITSIGLIESGEYLIMGNGQVDVAGKMTIKDNDKGGAFVNDADVVIPNMPASTLDYVYVYWNGSGLIGNLHLTHISIVVDSTLNALADDFSGAVIWKTSFAIPVTIQAVPEPTTIGLLMLGLTVFIGRKK
jgi:hypothetical protein